MNRNSRKLSDLIKELEDKGAISDYYIHYNWDNGKRELNIEFNNSVADKVIDDEVIKESDFCAFWE